MLLLWIAMMGIVGSDLGGTVEPAPRDNHPVLLSTELVPLQRIEAVLASTNYASFTPQAHATSAFYTTYFQPSLPPPAKKQLQQFDLIYQGYYETAGGQKQAYIKVGDALVVRPAGSNVIGDLAIADILLRLLNLTNSRGQSVTLEFNAKKSVEVPSP